MALARVDLLSLSRKHSGNTTRAHDAATRVSGTCARPFVPAAAGSTARRDAATGRSFPGPHRRVVHVPEQTRYIRHRTSLPAVVRSTDRRPFETSRSPIWVLRISSASGSRSTPVRVKSTPVKSRFQLCPQQNRQTTAQPLGKRADRVPLKLFDLLITRGLNNTGSGRLHRYCSSQREYWRTARRLFHRTRRGVGSQRLFVDFH